jgi:hypothetical protein
MGEVIRLKEWAKKKKDASPRKLEVTLKAKDVANAFPRGALLFHTDRMLDALESIYNLLEGGASGEAGKS